MQNEKGYLAIFIETLQLFKRNYIQTVEFGDGQEQLHYHHLFSTFRWIFSKGMDQAFHALRNARTPC